MKFSGRVAGLFALLSMTVATLLAWIPPAARPLPPPGLAPDLLSSLFPGTDRGWLLLRCACLAATICGGAWLARYPESVGEARKHASPARQAYAPVGSPWRDPAVAAALLAMLAVLACGGPWSKGWQIAWPFLTAGLALAVRGSRATRPGLDRRTLVGVAAAVPVAAAWVAARLWQSLGSPRRADLGDFLEGQRCIAAASRAGVDLLREGCAPGLAYLPWLPFGMGLLGNNGEPPTLDTLTLLNTALPALTALLVGLAAAGAGLGASSLVAMAVVLGSPLVLMHSLATPIFVFSFYTAAIAALVFLQNRRPDGRKLAALGALCGLAATMPNTVLVVPWAVFALACCKGWRTKSRLHGPVALLAFLVLALPSVPAWQQLLRGARELAVAERPWSVWEAGVAGQIAPLSIEALAQLPVDTTPATRTLGLLLAPWATPRTPMRLWGDVFIEPLGAGLALLAIVTLIGAALRRHRDANGLLLVALFAATLLPGIPTTYDRPSLTRIEALVVPMALLAACGSEILRRCFGLLGRRAAAGGLLALSFAMAALCGGSVLFDRTGAATLPQTALRIALDAVATSPLPVAFGERIAAEPGFARPVLASLRPSAELFAGAAAPETAATTILAWSPGEEETWQTGRRLCEAGFEGHFFVAEDATRLHRVFLAVPPGFDWKPTSGSGGQVRETSCAAGFPTESSRARAATNEAKRLYRAGHTNAATGLMLEAARASFAEPGLFADTAALLRRHGSDADWRFWARRACLAADRSSGDSCILLQDPGQLDDRAANFSAEAIVDPEGP